MPPRGKDWPKPDQAFGQKLPCRGCVVFVCPESFPGRLSPHSGTEDFDFAASPGKSNTIFLCVLCASSERSERVHPARPVAPSDGTGVKFFAKDSAADLTGVVRLTTDNGPLTTDSRLSRPDTYFPSQVELTERA